MNHAARVVDVPAFGVPANLGSTRERVGGRVLSARRKPDDSLVQRRPRATTPRLGELLVQAGVVDEDTIERLIAQQASKGAGRLGSLLIEQSLCTHEQIRDTLAKQMGVEVVDLDGRDPPHPEVANLLPRGVVRRYEVIPLKREGERLWLVMLDPYNLAAIDDIRFITGFSQITVVACVEADFKRYIQDHLDTNSLIDEIMEGETFFPEGPRLCRRADAGRGARRAGGRERGGPRPGACQQPVADHHAVRLHAGGGDPAAGQ